MKFHLKHFIAISAVTLAMLGAGGLMSNANRSAHASMPDPEFFHSTKHKDNVYYYITYFNKHAKDGNGQAYWYGKMPKIMTRRNYLFGLYYGKKFYKQYGHQSFFKVIHRHGQTYVPDYVGFVPTHPSIYIHGEHANVMEIYVNKRDIGKPYKNQDWAAMHSNYSKSNHYISIKSHHHAKKYHAKKHYRKAHKSVSKWRNSVPTSLRGTWKNRNSEFMFSNSDFNSKYLKVASFAGRYWHPQYKYNGNHTYSVRSGYIKHPAIGSHYKYGKVRLTGKNKAYIYGAGTYRRVSRRLIDNLK